VVIAAVLAWLVLKPGGSEDVVLNFADGLTTATQRRPTDDTFEVKDVTLGGESKHSITVKPNVGTRIVFPVDVPENAELHVSLGLLDEATTTEGDGVLFRVLVTANAIQEEVLNMHLNPFANAGDRGWHDVSLDLSQYAGERIEVFFNTNASLPGRTASDGAAGDFAVWGAPRVVRR
jgi:hypothetical protein